MLLPSYLWRQLDNKSYLDMWMHSKKYSGSLSVTQQTALSKDTFLTHTTHCVPICEESLWSLSCINKYIKEDKDFDHPWKTKGKVQASFEEINWFLFSWVKLYPIKLQNFESQLKQNDFWSEGIPSVAIYNSTSTTSRHMAVVINILSLKFIFLSSFPYTQGKLHTIHHHLTSILKSNVVSWTTWGLTYPGLL